MKYYINTFLIYSILGYVLETILKHLFFKSMNNGFLYGPWIPLYGLGVCIIIFIMRLIYNRFKVKLFVKVILLFFISMFTLTILELLGGIFIEIITNKIFWDYSNLKYNIGHFIALEISLVWGLMSIVITYIFKPLSDKIEKKIPSYLTYLVLLFYIVDFFITLINSL